MKAFSILKSIIISIFLFAFIPLVISSSLTAQNSKPTAQNPLPIINEILPNPTGSDTGNEWIELYNPSDAQIDLNGWEIRDKTGSFSLDGFIVAPKGYLVVYPSVSLNNSDEELTLDDNQGYQDKITYQTSTSGISLERVSPNCSDLLPHSTNDTKGKLNENYDPDFCSALGSIQIFSKEDNSNWNETHYYFLGTKVNFKPEITSSNSISDYLWKFDGISSSDAQPQFELKSLGNLDLELMVTFDTGETLGKAIHINIVPRLYLNELFPDPEGADAGKEWAELYNPNKFDVSIDNWKLTKGSKSQTLSGMIKSKSYFVITTEYSLTNTGAEISLFTPSGLNSDSFQYSSSETDKSWAREIDGVGEWGLSSPTKGTSNLTSETVINSAIGSNSQNTNWDKQQTIAATYDLRPELNMPFLYVFPKEYSTDEKEMKTIKTIDVNELGFGVLMSGGVVGYGTLILEKEELKKIASFLVKIIKG